MALLGGNLTPKVSVRLYDVDKGDTRVTVQGFGYYDNLKESAKIGSWSANVFGVSDLEYIKDIGIVCAPKLVLTDTRAVDFSFSFGDWEERLPDSGGPRTYRLMQFDASEDVYYEAASAYDLPSDIDFAVTLLLSDSSPEWDDGSFPPYMAVQWGSGDGTTWGVYFEKSKAIFQQYIDGDWKELAKLSGGGGRKGHGSQESAEIILYVRHLAGRVLVSLNEGDSYEGAGTELSPASSGSGPIVVSGQGGVALFGVHSLEYSIGNFISPPQDTLTPRTLPTAVLGFFGSALYGTSIVVLDDADHAAGIIQWNAELTPSYSDVTLDLRLYNSPTLKAVNYIIYPETVVQAPVTATPWDTRIEMMRVDKSEQLETSTAAWRVMLPRGTNLTQGYHGRRVSIDMGYRIEATATNVVENVFDGFIREMSLDADIAGRSYLNLTAYNRADWLRRQEWTELDCIALGGRTVNEAADHILAYRGLPLSTFYRIWHAWGNLVMMPEGSADDPFELIRAGEDSFTTLQRIMSYARLQITVSDDGILEAVPQTFVSGVHHEFHKNSDDLEKLLLSISHNVRYEEQVTALLVSGQDGDGRQLMAWMRDGEAEDIPASLRFVPHRITAQDTVSGSTTPAMLDNRAALMAQSMFGIQFLPTVTVFLNPALGRRDSSTFYGADNDYIPDGTGHTILGLTHLYQSREDDPQMETSILLRRQ